MRKGEYFFCAKLLLRLSFQFSLSRFLRFRPLSFSSLFICLMAVCTAFSVLSGSSLIVRHCVSVSAGSSCVLMCLMVEGRECSGYAESVVRGAHAADCCAC